jgi:hypothetical protein
MWTCLFDDNCTTLGLQLCRLQGLNLTSSSCYSRSVLCLRNGGLLPRQSYSRLQNLNGSSTALSFWSKCTRIINYDYIRAAPRRRRRCRGAGPEQAKERCSECIRTDRWWTTTATAADEPKDPNHEIDESIIRSHMEEREKVAGATGVSGRRREVAETPGMTGDGRQRRRWWPAPDVPSGAVRMNWREWWIKKMKIAYLITHDIILQNQFNVNYKTVVEYDYQNTLILLSYSLIYTNILP